MACGAAESGLDHSPSLYAGRRHELQAGLWRRSKVQALPISFRANQPESRVMQETKKTAGPDADTAPQRFLESLPLAAVCRKGQETEQRKELGNGRPGIGKRPHGIRYRGEKVGPEAAYLAP